MQIGQLTRRYGALKMSIVLLKRCCVHRECVSHTNYSKSKKTMTFQIQTGRLICLSCLVMVWCDGIIVFLSLVQSNPWIQLLSSPTIHHCHSTRLLLSLLLLVLPLETCFLFQYLHILLSILHPALLVNDLSAWQKLVHMIKMANKVRLLNSWLLTSLPCLWCCLYEILFHPPLGNCIFGCQTNCITHHYMYITGEQSY